MTNIELCRLELDAWKQNALLYGHALEQLDKISIDYPEDLVGSKIKSKKDDAKIKKPTINNLKLFGFGKSR
ncbi:hypothetical protein KKE60_08120 [Patescibacteria group bacterium]|nr:hypothetical protein [Patescibacteria group bacterium]